MILPLPLEQCRAIVESLELPYPLYADPDWEVFKAYGTGHILYAPKQSWVGVDQAGIVRYLWRVGDEVEGTPTAGVRQVQPARDALQAFEATLQ